MLKLQFGYDNLVIELQDEQSKLDDLIRALVKKCKQPKIGELLLDPDSGRPSGSIITVVDGKPVKHGHSEKVFLKNGSVVEFFIAVDGG